MRIQAAVLRHPAKPFTIEDAELDDPGPGEVLVEGEAVPQLFIPTLIRLWGEGRFPFDRLIRRCRLSGINEAERDSASGVTVKPVLLPGS